jgi:hypothetical protein
MFFNVVDTPSTHRENRTLPSDKAGLKPIAPGKYNLRHVGNEGSIQGGGDCIDNTTNVVYKEVEIALITPPTLNRHFKFFGFVMMYCILISYYMMLGLGLLLY